MGNYDFFSSKRNQDGSPPKVNCRRCQQEEMLPRELVRVPGLINHWNSSLAWVFDQNLWMFSDCKELQVEFQPISYIYFDCVEFSKLKGTSKCLPIWSRKKTFQVHTYLLKTAFLTVLRPQLSVPQMIHFKVRLTRKAEQNIVCRREKTNHNRNTWFFQGHFIYIYNRISASCWPTETPSGRYLEYLWEKRGKICNRITLEIIHYLLFLVPEW